MNSSIIRKRSKKIVKINNFNKKIYYIVINILLFVCIIIYFLFAICEIYLIPNFLNIDFYNHDLIITLFSNISIILASIFGIIIAIFLVSFQIFKRNNVSSLVNEFLSDSNIVSLFILYLSSILISYISLTFIKQNIYPHKIINLFYLSFILFIICITLLYSLIKSILSSEFANIRTKEIISRLKYSDISNYLEKHSILLTTLPKDYKNIDKNPHFTIEEMLVNTVRRKENFAIIGFYEQLNLKIKDLINKSRNSEEKKNIFKFFNELYVHPLQVAINEQEESILSTILNSVVVNYFYCINKDLKGEDIEELDNILAELFILMVESNNLLPIRFPVYLLFIKNCIIILLKKQKEYIIDYPEKRLLGLLHNITNRAIIAKAENIVREALKNLFDIIYETIESSGILPLKKIEIVYQNCFYYKYYFLKIANKEYYNEDILNDSFSFDKLLILIRKDTDLAKQMIILYCTILLELIDRGILDEFSIENLSKIGINIIESKDIVNSNEYILYIFNKISEMLDKIEISSSIIPEKYNILSKHASKMRKMVVDDKQKFSKIYDKMSDFYNFDSSIIIREPLKDWPKLD